MVRFICPRCGEIPYNQVEFNQDFSAIDTYKVVGVTEEGTILTDFEETTSYEDGSTFFNCTVCGTTIIVEGDYGVEYL